MADKKIKAGDLVEVTGTGNSPHLKEGAKKVVHEVVAAKLVQLGHASIGEPIDLPKRGKSKKEKLEM